MPLHPDREALGLWVEVGLQLSQPRVPRQH
jgi:hypothetical protein